jgi:PAS domain S-box-containing protein
MMDESGESNSNPRELSAGRRPIDLNGVEAGASLRRQLAMVTEFSRALLEGTCESVLVHTLEAGEGPVVLDLSVSACRLLGCTREEALNRRVDRLFAEPWREHLWGVFERCRYEGAAAVMLSGDDQRPTVNFESHAIRVGDQHAGVTFLRPVEAEPEDGVEAFLDDASQPQDRFPDNWRALLDASPAAIISCDLDGRVREWNLAAEKLFGWRREEVVGQPLPIVPEEERAKHRDLFQRAAAEGLPSVEVRRQHKEGHLLDLRLSSAALRDERGEVVALIGVFQDVSDQKRSERRLRQSEQTLRSLFDALEELVLIRDGSGRILSANRGAEQLLGYSFEELAKMDFRRLEPTCERLLFPQDLPDDRAVVREGLYRCRDGRELPVEISLRRITFRDEPAVLSVARDASWRKQLELRRERDERRARQMQKLDSLGTLAGGVAHEFNNILAAILGNAELLLMELDADSPHRASLEEICRSTSRASQLSHQMLTFSGQGTFLFSPVEINRAIRDIEHLMRAAVSRSIELDVQLDGDLPPVRADAAQLQEILLALLRNASEAIGERSGRIEVRTRGARLDSAALAEAQGSQDLSEGPYVLLEVRDDGCGMKRETLERIFDPFFSTKFTGRGMGLGSVLGIVRAHGGGMLVESEPDVGTLFTVLLPACEAPCAADEVAARPRAADDGQGPCVLIAEDEESVRRFARRVLQRHGFEVIEACDGAEAVELLRRRDGQVDAMVLDATMPRLGGPDTLERIRRIAPDLPVLLCSGYPEPAAVQRFEKAECVVGFLQKPFRITELVEKISEAARRARDDGR